MPAEQLTSKEKMLRDLEEIQRKVTTGEVIGIVLVVHTTDHSVLSRVSGDPPTPLGVLILQEIADDARRSFLDANNHPDDGRPRLRAAGDEEHGAAPPCAHASSHAVTPNSARYRRCDDCGVEFTEPREPSSDESGSVA